MLTSQGLCSENINGGIFFGIESVQDSIINFSSQFHSSPEDLIESYTPASPNHRAAVVYTRTKESVCSFLSQALAKLKLSQGIRPWSGSQLQALTKLQPA